MHHGRCSFRGTPQNDFKFFQTVFLKSRQIDLAFDSGHILKREYRPWHSWRNAQHDAIHRPGTRIFEIYERRDLNRISKLIELIVHVGEAVLRGLFELSPHREQKGPVVCKLYQEGGF